MSADGRVGASGGSAAYRWRASSQSLREGPRLRASVAISGDGVAELGLVQGMHGGGSHETGWTGAARGEAQWGDGSRAAGAARDLSEYDDL
jgi:hypothetical protein